MANDDLSKLKIDKSQPAFRTTKRKRTTFIRIAVAVIVLILILAWTGVFSPATKVEVATVSRPTRHNPLPYSTRAAMWCSEESAIAAKITGRLIGLYVEEGSKIKKGQLIAQLENEDLTASRKQIAANLDVSRTNLEQAKAELHDATLEFSGKEPSCQRIHDKILLRCCRAGIRKLSLLLKGLNLR